MFIFFSTQFNNNNNKICQTHGFNPTHVGWVEFFLTHHGGLGQKISLIRPMHSPTIYKQLLINIFQQTQNSFHCKSQE